MKLRCVKYLRRLFGPTYHHELQVLDQEQCNIGRELHRQLFGEEFVFRLRTNEHLVPKGN